jgi:hypothetical protein
MSEGDSSFILLRRIHSELQIIFRVRGNPEPLSEVEEAEGWGKAYLPIPSRITTEAHAIPNAAGI